MVIPMSSTAAPEAVAALQSLFAKYSFFEQLVSDNDPHFTSENFAHFMEANGIEHISSAPYHPSSSGHAEWFVQTYKRAVRAEEKGERMLSAHLAKFPLGYCSIPQTIMNISSCL